MFKSLGLRLTAASEFRVCPGPDLQPPFPTVMSDRVPSRWNADGSRLPPSSSRDAAEPVPRAAPLLLPRSKRLPADAPKLEGGCAPPSLRPRFTSSPLVALDSARVSSGSSGFGGPCASGDFPPTLPPTNSVMRPGTMWEAFTNAKNAQIQLWLSIAAGAAAHSDVITSLLQSPNANMLLARLVQPYAPSTLAAYFGKWKQWAEFCEIQSFSAFEPTVVVAADFLALHCRGKLGSAIGWIKALRFMAKNLELPTLRACLQSEVVRSFGKSVNVVERRETAPLPLSFVLWLERQVVEVAGSTLHRLQCGMLLVLVFASLRWSDGQWSPPSHIHCSGSALLGMAARTKTTSRSMPWAAWAPGFLARPQTGPGWGQAWLCLLQEAVQRTAINRPEFVPDFFVAEFGSDPAAPVFQAPLARDSGILLIRRLLTDCYKTFPCEDRPDLSLIGVHSPKVTLLSMSKQLLLDENLRREQGHHRPAPGLAMSRLYGRDDVSGPLALQQKLVHAVASGFRPLRPSMRGARPPLPDVRITVPALEPMPATASPAIPKLLERGPLELERDSSSDSCSEGETIPAVESQSALPASAWKVIDASSGGDEVQSLGEPEEFEFLYNPLTKIVHLAKACTADHPACQFRPVVPSSTEVPLRPGCSIRGNLAIGALVRSAVIPKGARLCLKHGCGRDPALASLLEA